MKSQIEYSDFEKIDLRVGTITRVEEFPEAKKPAYKLEIDFGEEIGDAVWRIQPVIVKYFPNNGKSRRLSGGIWSP